MSRMVTVMEIEQAYGVPANVTRSAIKKLQIKNQKTDGLISITLQDAEPIIFNYHARQGSYTWQDVAKKLCASPGNQQLKRIIDFILPHYCLASGTYYPVRDAEDVINHLEHYHIKKYKDKYYYLEGGREDFYITNYFTISEFRQSFNKKYESEIKEDEKKKLKLHNFSKIKSQLKKSYPVENVNLFGFSEYMIPWEYMEQLMEDYHNYYAVKEEKDPYDRYAREIKNLGNGQGRLDKTMELFDVFVNRQLEKTKNQMQKVKTMASLWKYLLNTLDKEIYLYKNEEIFRLIKSARIRQRENAELCLFLKFVAEEYEEESAFDVRLSPKREAKVKSEQDFYTEEEWEGYVNFIFDIDLHIEKAFTNPLYAKYWLYCMLQCSLAWRVEDILNMPALQMDVEKYTPEWFEQNEFTYAMAWEIVNAAGKFIEQDRVNKTGAKKHFIILNSFALATAIGFIICERHRQAAGDTGLFGKFWFNYKIMANQLGSEIEGFSNLKATRTILSFANETASHMDYSKQAVSIASYMRSHIAGKRGFSDMTTTYLKSSFDERELLSLPYKMGELGLFGWLYNEILSAIDKTPETDKEELIGAVREEIAPDRLEKYSGYLLQEQKKRAEIVAEIMEYDAKDLKELCAGLGNGTSRGKKEDIYCIKSSCKYPTSQNCELCGYAVPSIHALHVIGQEASGLLDKLISGQGTERDRERYSFQLFKLLTILKEAKEEFGEEFVSSFADYKIIGKKLGQLQNTKKGVE